MNIVIWLLILSIMTFMMILIGGLTRLTDSGLSIVDWKPIMGFIPPLNEQNWLAAFENYKNSPEFKIVNNLMNISEFKYIYWWEWFHRFFARCLGIVLIFPMIFFLFKKKISRKLFVSLFIVLIFGIVQAIVGWWMVKSGLNDDPYVSPYRLAFHLSNAIIILSILTWITLNTWLGSSGRFLPQNNLELIFFILLFFLFITIISGAFMSGTNAGLSFNTYPLMNGNFIPEDYYIRGYGIRNIFENTVMINFNHRWLATLTFVAIIFLTICMKFSSKFKNLNVIINLIIIFALLQFFLGIFTLLTNVKIILASLHQINSILLLTSLLSTYRFLKTERNF